MIAFTYVSVLICCLAFAEASEAPEEGIPLRKSPNRLENSGIGNDFQTGPDVARRELGGPLLWFPLRVSRPPVVKPIQTLDQTETNEIEAKDEKQPLFIFTTYEGFDNPAQRKLPTSGPYIEIRKKRAASVEVPGTQKVNLRKKRTYCGKCGGGGYGGYYIPVTYAVYPVYGGGHGGGCNTCGGGYKGGGGGGSYSFSSSSAQSSSGSFGWGKK